MSIEKLLEDLTAALIANTEALKGGGNKTEAKPAAAKEETKTKAKAEPKADEGSDDDDSSKVTFAYLGKLVSELALKDKPAVVAILAKFNAKKLGDVSEDDYVKLDIQLVKLRTKLAAAAEDDDLA